MLKQARQKLNVFELDNWSLFIQSLILHTLSKSSKQSPSNFNILVKLRQFLFSKVAYVRSSFSTYHFDRSIK